MDIQKLLNQVKDSESFLEFAQALANDQKISIDKSWKNTSIESFLESATAWAIDSNFGVSQGLLPSNPWRQFATFLYCGKIYE
ncbi:MAG: hypothetical protein KGO49_05775 [Gammaproteobacteria bacterium]|nr:hypothetical protein [Gammaproteobacteria bacterium]